MLVGSMSGIRGRIVCVYVCMCACILLRTAYFKLARNPRECSRRLRSLGLVLGSVSRRSKAHSKRSPCIRARMSEGPTERERRR